MPERRLSPKERRRKTRERRERKRDRELDAAFCKTWGLLPRQRSV